MIWDFPVGAVRFDWEVGVAGRGSEELEEVHSCVVKLFPAGVGLGRLWKRV